MSLPPVRVGRIICDILPYSASNGNETSKTCLKVEPPSPPSPQVLGNAHIFVVSPKLEVPPRLVVVDPTPNPTPHPTPHPTPPASPLLASASAAAQLQKQEKVRGKEHSNFNNPKTKTKHSASSSASQQQKHEKGKGREHSNLNSKIKAKHSPNSVSSALAAKVKHTLADPLLPGQHKRTIVLTTSESEYEHSDDDGSWSSEEMGSEDEEVSFLLLRYILVFFFFFMLCMGSDFFPSLFFIIGRAETGLGEAGSIIVSATAATASTATASTATTSTTATASTTTPYTSISCAAYAFI